MNLPSESQHLSSNSSSYPIVEGEIIDSQPHPRTEPTIDLELVPFTDNIGENKAISLKLTPWGLGAIVLFLLSNLILTWAQLSKPPVVETVQTLPEIPPMADKQLHRVSKSQISPDALSTVPQPLKPSAIVPPPPQTVAKVPTPPNPPQPKLSERLLPPALRPQPVTLNQRITPPPTVVPVSIPYRNQHLEPIPVPPSNKPEVITAPIPQETPELSKEAQLRNILRQQIVREEAEMKPPLTFNQRTRQEMLDKKLRNTTPQPSIPIPTNVVSSPSQVTTPNPRPPAPPVSPSVPQVKPENVNQLVNQLESLNQK